MHTDLLLILIGLGLLLIVGIFVVITSIKKTGDKKEANEFLQGLSNELKDMILDTIRSFKPGDIDISEEGIAKIETEILKKIYDTSWDYIKEVVEKKSQEDTDFFTNAVLALLQNRDFVEKFIIDLINGSTIQTVIHSRAEYIQMNTAEKRMVECEEREKEMEEAFSSVDDYINDDEDYSTSGEDLVIPTEEELAELNPQIDEPEELDPENDPSVEIIEDDDIYYDKSGRARSKKTGKWTKDPRK